MSNPAANVPISYKQSTDVSFTELTTNPIGFYFWIEKGLIGPALVRGEDDVLLGEPGRFRRNRRTDRRLIVIRGIVMGTGTTWAAQLTNYRNRMENLEALLDPTDYGVLQAELETTSTVAINVWPLPDWNVNEIGPTLAELSIGFVSVDPDWTVTGS